MSLHHMPFYIVDVFTEQKYAGNQLAVFLGEPDSATMQQLALEMNFSETTFITALEPTPEGYPVRIFTKVEELPFAGHPTLGTAYIIQREILKQSVPQVDLQLGVGTIPVTFEADGTLWMHQKPVRFGHVFDRSEIAAVLGVDSDDIDDGYPIQEASTGNPHMLVPMKSLDAAKRAVVDVPHWRQLLETRQPELAVKSICIFTTETEYPENDLHVRAFGPLRGVTEDPATGSAIGNLAGYLVHYDYFGSEPLEKKRVEQGYAINRPSLLLFSAQRQADHIAIHVGGKVRMVAQGSLIDEDA